VASDNLIFQDTAMSGRNRWAAKGAMLAGILILAGLILVTLKLGELEHFLRLAQQARPVWLIVALILQSLTYVSAAAAWHVPLARASHPISLLKLIPLGLAKLFTDQAIPSGGVSGNILVAKGLSLRGVPTRLVMAALLVGIIAYYAAYLLLVLAALAILWLHHQVHKGFLAAIAVFSTVAVVIPTAVIWLKRNSNRRLPVFFERFHAWSFLRKAIDEVPSSILRDPMIILKTTFYEAAVFLLDAGTLWVMLTAIGQEVPPSVALTSFMAASVAGTIGPIPLGLGTFEAVSVATLGILGVQIEPALTATLLLRGFSFWLPMAPGLYLAKREMRGTIV